MFLLYPLFYFKIKQDIARNESSISYISWLEYQNIIYSAINVVERRHVSYVFYVDTLGTRRSVPFNNRCVP